MYPFVNSLVDTTYAESESSGSNKKQKQRDVPSVADFSAARPSFSHLSFASPSFAIPFVDIPTLPDSSSNDNNPLFRQERFMPIDGDESFISTGSDESYVPDNTGELPSENRLRKKMYYLLSLNEIIPQSSNFKVKYFFEEITFEKSSINILAPDKWMSLLFLVLLSQKFLNHMSNLLHITYNKDMQLVGVNDLNEREKGLSCALYLQSLQIKKGSDVLPSAISRKFSAERNAESDFSTKYISFFISTLSLSSKLHLDWGTTSNIYKNFPVESMQCCRHDVIISTAEGIDIGTGEIKPPNATIDLIDIDRGRIEEAITLPIILIVTDIYSCFEIHSI